MSTNLPVTNLPLMYVNNLQIARASNTTLTMAAGQARDSTNTNDIVLATSATLNAATNGANGLDTGALANATWYAVYIIGSSVNAGPSATILSTSATAPILPTGYDVFRLIGWMLTDSSAHFLAVNIYGNGSNRKYFWDAIATELNATGSATYAAIDMSSSVAPSSRLVYLNWKLAPATAGNLTLLRPTGSASTTNIQLTGSVASQPNAGVLTMNCSAAQSIDYINASASDHLSIYVVGFEDFI